MAVPNGQLLVEEQEIDWNRTANAVEVDTVAKGWAGTSPGSPKIVVDVGNAMPSGGFEFDAGPYVSSQVPVPFQILGPGGKSMKGDCIFMHDGGKHGVGQQARYTFTLMMAITQWQ